MTTSDVTVKVGAAECKVTSLSQSYLICTPPAPDEEGVGTNPKVIVHVGANFNYTVGKLKYESSSMEILSLPTIIGIGAGGGILILIIIVVCIAYRQKSRESDRVMKRMQNQMDVLEARVAKECKEGKWRQFYRRFKGGGHGEDPFADQSRSVLMGVRMEGEFSSKGYFMRQKMWCLNLLFFLLFF